MKFLRNVVITIAVFFGLLLAVIVFGAATGNNYKQSDAYKIAKAQVAAGQYMKDPKSAQFSGTVISKNGDVVGYINAKNSFGSYNGYKLFIYNHKTGNVIFPKN